MPALVKDGPVDPEVYSREPLRILWVLKEIHDAPQTHPEIVDSLREIARRGRLDRAWGPTWRRVAKVSYGLLHQSRPWEQWAADPSVYVPALGRIAAINVKKTGGGRATNPAELAEAFRCNEGRLRDQIYIEAKPHIVIGGNVLTLFQGWFDHDVKSPGDTFDAWTHEGIVWVNAYHPQYQVVDREYFDRIRSAIDAGRR